jgi:hypothetical protein
VEQSPKISVDEVVAALLQNPDLINCELYHQWRSQEEDRIERCGNQSDDNILLTLQDARLRYQAGLRDLAILAFEEALELVELLGDTEQAEKIREEMQQLEWGKE